jgi:putative membrane protein
VRRFIYRVICGFFLGLSIFAPGLSGSVIAIGMGIYPDLIDILAQPLRNKRQNALFCAPLAVGAALSAVLFVLVFGYLFDTYEKTASMLFIGLIAGSLPVVAMEIKTHGLKARYLPVAAAAFAAAFAFGLLSPPAGETSPALPLFAAGGLAGGIAAPVPGLSVSMVLMGFGLYAPLLSMAGRLVRFDFGPLLPFLLFVLGALAGLVLAARLIKRVFAKYPCAAHCAVFGFIAGCLCAITAQTLRLEDAGYSAPVGVLVCAAGLAVSVSFVFLRRLMK